MTTFEIIMIILAMLAVLLIGMLIKRITYVGHILLETIGDIASNNAERISTTNGHLFDISQQLNHIEDDIIEGLHDIRLGDKIVGLGFQNGFPPCYAPNGICTNPQMDCINCPKRGTGGTWSTSTNIIKEE